MDRFSNLVIYTTLRALAVAGRSIWDRYYNGDRLIFGPQDFLAPEESALFRDLWRLANRDVQNLTGHLFLAAKGPLNEVPMLESLIINDAVVELTPSQRRVVERDLGRREQVGTYQAEISRSKPLAILLLVDQSLSMGDPMQPGGTSKADFAADVVNRLLTTAVIRCSKNAGVYDLFHAGVIVYSDKADFGLMGPLKGRSLIPMGELMNLPLRVETRERMQDDGAGGIVRRVFKQPVWLDASAKNGSAACAALRLAQESLARFIAEHPDSFPPIVLWIADGMATDGNLAEQADMLCQLRTKDGPVLLFPMFLSCDVGASVRYPAKDSGLPPDALPFFHMSSRLPASMSERAYKMGHSVVDETRGFAWNTDLIDVLDMLTLGTRTQPRSMEEQNKSPAARPPDAVRPVKSERHLVFISSKSEDYGHARAYYEFLTERGLRAFLSCESLPALGTSDYREAIDQALDEAKHMIVVTSSATNVRSSWVKAEWGLFINEKRSDRKSGNLVTVIVGTMGIAELPASLRYYEVIAAGPEAFERLFQYVAR